MEKGFKMIIFLYVTIVLSFFISGILSCQLLFSHFLGGDLSWDDYLLPIVLFILGIYNLTSLVGFTK